MSTNSTAQAATPATIAKKFVSHLSPAAVRRVQVTGPHDAMIIDFASIVERDEQRRCLRVKASAANAASFHQPVEAFPDNTLVVRCTRCDVQGSVSLDRLLFAPWLPNGCYCASTSETAFESVVDPFVERFMAARAADPEEVGRRVCVVRGESLDSDDDDDDFAAAAALDEHRNASNT